MKRGSPARLRDGSWGVTVNGPVEEGEEILVVTRSGAQWYAEVTRKVWTDGEKTLVATKRILPDAPDDWGYDHPDYERGQPY